MLSQNLWSESNFLHSAAQAQHQRLRTKKIKQNKTKSYEPTNSYTTICGGLVETLGTYHQSICGNKNLILSPVQSDKWSYTHIELNDLQMYACIHTKNNQWDRRICANSERIYPKNNRNTNVSNLHACATALMPITIHS